MDRATVLHSDDVDVERWDDPRRGTVTWRTLFSGDRTPTSSLTVGFAELPPQDAGAVGNPTHCHAAAEVYYITEGEGVVVIDGVSYDVRAGTAVFIPGDAQHSLANTGSTPLRLLYAFAADSFDDITYVFAPR